MKCITLLTCIVCILSTAAAASTYSIRPDGTGDFPTIQAGLDAGQDGDVLELADGIFTGPGNRDIDFLGKAITVESQSGDPELCIIDCEGSEAEPHRGFIFQNGEDQNSILRNVQITGGFVQYSSGGAITSTGSPTISGCLFYANTADFNGGALNFGSWTTPSITNCSFVENVAMMNGGGLYLIAVTSASVEDCEFIGNQAHAETGGGGGLASTGESEVTISGCEFVDNSAPYGGAMIYSHGDLLTVADCYFDGNTATTAGILAVSFGGAVATISGCTFVGNHGTNYGGIRIRETHVTVTHCTFYGNSSLLWTGGNAFSLYDGEGVLENNIVAYGDGVPIGMNETSTVSISCSDFYGNEHGDWYGAYAEQRFINDNYCCIPVFCDPSTGDFTLAANSPLVPDGPSNPNCGQIGAWPVDPDCVVTAAPEAEAPRPLALLGAVPNPFNPKTEIRFELADEASVTLEIYDTAGRRVATLLDRAALPAGGHTAKWHGRDDAGAAQPSGIYFCRLAAGEHVETGKLTLLK